MSDAVKMLCQRMHTLNRIIPKKCCSYYLSLSMVESTQINQLINPSHEKLVIGFEHNRPNLL